MTKYKLATVEQQSCYSDKQARSSSEHQQLGLSNLSQLIAVPRVFSVSAKQSIKSKTHFTVHILSFLAQARTLLAAASTLNVKGSPT